jgi:hypothetical protein
MALVTTLRENASKSNSVHAPVDCTFSIVVDRQGKSYLQLDTYGRPDRRFPEKVSQSIQFDEASGRQLKELLERVFPG